MKAAHAVHRSGVNSFWAKMTAANTKRFFTHCRGRRDTRSAANVLMRRPVAVTGRPVSPEAAIGRARPAGAPHRSLSGEPHLRARLADPEEADREAELGLVLGAVDELRADGEALE